MEEVWKVDTEIHLKVSKGSHSRTREDARTSGVKRMIQSSFHREITELKKRLSKVTELLHEEATGGQYYVWRLNKKVQWLVNRLCARDFKHKHSVWVKKEERLREAEHEEFHVMCEPKQGVYLEEEKEDVDTDFVAKLLDMERCSYRYEMGEEDVDMISFEDVKDSFVETN